VSGGTVESRVFANGVDAPKRMAARRQDSTLKEERFFASAMGSPRT
jgi:hypothetical protein